VSWLEQIGCKSTNTHLYLMEPALQPAGETRPLSWLLQRLGERLELTDFFPWQNEEAAIDAILNHPSTGYANVALLRAQGGIGALQVSHVAYPDHRYHTPSGKVEFYSARARAAGLASPASARNFCAGTDLSADLSARAHAEPLP
jgi:anaerobic selenocysteine-containing dehydrogenase